MQYLVNPDSRPLPPGWNQHYDSQKQTWYYVCMNVRPPHVSSSHPLGPIREAIPPIEEYSNPEIQSVTSLPESASLNSSPVQPRSPSSQPQPSGLSFAQQLYASSIKSAGNNSSYFTRESSAVQPLSAPLTSIPTPPNSPPPNDTQTPPSVTSSLINFDPSELYGTPIASRSRRQGSIRHSSSGVGAIPGSVDHPFPRRSQSYQLTTSPIQESFQPHPHRASTLTAGNSRSNGTPTLVTTARPPANLSTPVSQTLVAAPPNLSALSTTAVQAETYPIQPLAQALLPPTPISAQFSQPNRIQNQASQPPKGNELNPAFKHIGLAVGQFALNMAGGAVKASLGLPQTGGGVGGAIGKALVNGSLDGSFATGLSGLGDQGNGLDASQMQVDTQGQPAIDYQSTINNLMQQQQAQPTPGVNYQTLINQLQQNLHLTNPQQQHTVPYTPQAHNQLTSLGSNIQRPMQTSTQAPMSGYQNAHNAQIQALSASEQQYQDALRVQMQQINAAAAQEVAQAQQNAQNILQAAHQQQQQVQLQQQQQLQQMQAAYSRPATQPAVVHQTRPPPGPSGLNTLLTGVGSVLSSFAHAPGSASDSYTSDTSVGNLGAYDSFPDMGSDPTTDSSY